MAIREELLYEENVLTQEELAKVLNPFDENILNEYGNDINLSGYSEVVSQYAGKVNSYIQYGNCDKNNKNYKEVIEQDKIVRYRVKINGEYFDCLPDTEGAEPYDYIFQSTKYIEEQNQTIDFISLFKKQKQVDGDNVVLEFTDIDLPEELKSFNKCDITPLLNNFARLKYLLYNEKVITKKVAVWLIKDILNGINQAKQELKQWYDEKRFFDKDKHIDELPLIKQNYVNYHNAYEKLKQKQSLNLVKADISDGKELDFGL